jgi:tape measure domain-containing protein
VATEEVGIRLTLQGRREAAAGLADTTKQIEGVGTAAEETGKKASRGFLGLKKFGGFLGTMVKGGLIAAGTASVVGLGVALHKGFARLNAIDQAKAKLTGLGHSAKAVDRIMVSALKSVKGTAFGMDEADTTAAGAVAAGIKPGRQLTKMLKLVADAATIGGTSMADMGSIFNKVATSNKVQGDVIAQLSDKGIPVVKLLSKELGVSAAETVKLASAGKINFATFAKAMQKGVGGAALSSGKTFTGAWKNLGASVSRIGAGFLGGNDGKGGLFAHLAPGVTSLTKAMAPLETQAGNLGNKVGKVLGPALENAVPWVSRMVDRLGHLDLKSVASGASGIGGSFSKIGDALSGVDWSQVGTAFGKGASDSISVFAVVVGFLANHLQTLAKWMPEILAGFVAWKAAQAAQNVLGLASIPIRTLQAASNIALARAMRANTVALQLNNGVQTESTAISVRSRIATLASKALALAMRGATLAWAGAQKVLNLVMSNNPLGWAIKITMLLVGAFILAYKKSETFRRIVDGALHGIAAAAQWMWNSVLKPVFKLWLNTWFTIIGAIVHGAANAFGWVKGIGGKLKAAAAQFDNFRDSVNRSLDGIHNKTVNVMIRANPAPAAIAKPTPAWLQPGKVKARANGGPVVAGRPYVVGERRPELFVPRVNGFIRPEVPRGVNFDELAPTGTEGAPSGRGGDLRVAVVLDEKVLGEAVVKDFRNRQARS